MSHPPERFAAIYKEYACLVRKIIHRLSNPNDLDDLVQVAFVKIHENLDSLRDEAQLKAWICRIAVNTAKDHLRKKRRNAWLLFFSPLEMPEVPSPTRENDPRELRRVLNYLPPRMRETVILFSIEELEVKEVAAALAIPEGTVKSRLSQARARLKKVFRKEDNHERRKVS